MLPIQVEGRPALRGHFMPNGETCPPESLLAGPCSGVAVCHGFRSFLRAELGIPADAPEPEPHRAAPAEGCTCGFYLLWRPTPEWGGLLNYGYWSDGACWLYVMAIGKTVLHAKGARTGRYRVLLAFPPAQGWPGVLAGLRPGAVPAPPHEIVGALRELLPFCDDDWRCVPLPGGYYTDRRSLQLAWDLMEGMPWREALARWQSA